MAQYLSPFSGIKKTVNFEQKEEELRHAIKHDFDLNKLHKAAEKLRTVKLSLIKTLRKAAEPFTAEANENLRRRRELDKEEKEWTSLSVDEIVGKYRHQ